MNPTKYCQCIDCRDCSDYLQCADYEIRTEKEKGKLSVGTLKMFEMIDFFYANKHMYQKVKKKEESL